MTPLESQTLNHFVYKSNLFMKPVFNQAKKDIKRVVLSEGEDERVLHAAQQIVSQKLAFPILIGRPNVIEARLKKLGLTIQAGKDFELVNNENDPRYREYWEEYYRLRKRQGVTEEMARRRMIGNTTLIGAMMVHLGHADALVCGTMGRFRDHFQIMEEIIGYNNPERNACAMNALILSGGSIFITDTYVNAEPNAEQLAAGTLMCVEEMERFGIVPKVALLANSNFGSIDSPSSRKMQTALGLIQAAKPDLEIDGEMQGDAALNESIRQQIMPDSPLKGSANLLVMPDVETANISYNLLRVSASDGVTIGPILMGMAKPVHIVTPISSVRRIVNMVALAAVDAQRQHG